MTDTSNTLQTDPAQPARQTVLGTKIPSVSTLAIAVLMFLLPFVDIKCNDTSIKELSGVQLATGYNVQINNDNSMVGQLERTTGTAKKDNNGDVNVFALAALIASVLALLFAFMKQRGAITLTLVTAVIGAIALIALYVDVKRQVKNSMHEDMAKQGNDMNFGGIGQASIHADFTAAFYIAVLALIAGAYFSYRRKI